MSRYYTQQKEISRLRQINKIAQKARSQDKDKAIIDPAVGLPGYDNKVNPAGDYAPKSPAIISGKKGNDANPEAGDEKKKIFAARP